MGCDHISRSCSYLSSYIHTCLHALRKWTVCVCVCVCALLTQRSFVRFGSVHFQCNDSGLLTEKGNKINWFILVSYGECKAQSQAIYTKAWRFVRMVHFSKTLKNRSINLQYIHIQCVCVFVEASTHKTPCTLYWSQYQPINKCLGSFRCWLMSCQLYVRKMPEDSRIDLNRIDLYAMCILMIENCWICRWPKTINPLYHEFREALHTIHS